jgi:hypothetical protein
MRASRVVLNHCVRQGWQNACPHSESLRVPCKGGWSGRLVSSIHGGRRHFRGAYRAGYFILYVYESVLGLYTCVWRRNGAGRNSRTDEDTFTRAFFSCMISWRASASSMSLTFNSSCSTCSDKRRRLFSTLLVIITCATVCSSSRKYCIIATTICTSCTEASPGLKKGCKNECKGWMQADDAE